MVSDEETQEHFDDFFEDVFVEIEDKYGEIDEMNVCDNLGDHLVGGYSFLDFSKCLLSVYRMSFECLFNLIPNASLSLSRSLPSRQRVCEVQKRGGCRESG